MENCQEINTQLDRYSRASPQVNDSGRKFSRL